MSEHNFSNDITRLELTKILNLEVFILKKNQKISIKT